MSRTAESSIKGYVYQFNKSLAEILSARDDSVVTIEGVVEDIDVCSTTGLKAIQCKYHEEQKKFTLSLVYKPILLMLLHYSKTNRDDIRYNLFAHFPGKEHGKIRTLEIDELKKALSSKNQDLKALIEKIDAKVNKEAFLRLFEIEFGPKLESIQAENIDGLAKIFPKDNIEGLVFPNAIQHIMGLSILPDQSSRQVSREQFLSHIRTLRSAVLSKWTLSLKSYEESLKLKRQQLRQSFATNTGKRVFAINPSGIEDFSGSFPVFVKSYVGRFFCKSAHQEPPTFFLSIDDGGLDQLILALYALNIRVNDGCVRGQFQVSEFLRNPVVKHAKRERESEFAARITTVSRMADVLASLRPSDLYIIGDVPYEVGDRLREQMRVDAFELSSVRAIEYIIGVRDTYE